MITYKIVLIENQKIQFDTISDLFRDKPGSDIHYEIFPKEEEFTLFIDCIKVYLNQYYKPEHNKSALENLVNMIHNFHLNAQDNTEPDAFIIDHKLVGCHKSLSGIDLAIELRNNHGYKEQPMIFLSRTSRSDPKVMEGLPKLSGVHEWIPKGYAGKEILDKDYFKENVLDIIPKLINERKQRHIIYLMKEIHHIIENIFKAHRKNIKEDEDQLLQKYSHLKPDRLEYCLNKKQQLIDILQLYPSKNLIEIENAKKFIEEIKLL